MGELCEQVGDRGYPTIKYGDPNDLQDYKGGRKFDDLKKFAEGLGPQCGPAHLDLCDAAKKKQIEEFQAMGSAEREKRIAEKDKDIEAVKASGLGLLKSVHAHAKKTKTEL